MPGSFGSFADLKTSEKTQAMRADGVVINDLYAASADMMSVSGGYYPAGGINLGPAMTFGHVARKHTARQL